MKYCHSITDKFGYVHSIDNVVYVYYIKNYNMKTVADELIGLRKSNNYGGWEKLNCSPCSKYSWYQNVIHFENAIHISFGKMQSFDKISRKWDILPLLRLEVNPSKHYDKKVFQDVLEWIRNNCTSGTLKKYDYAVDVPYPINVVKVYNSKKEAGLYKGTIYRGQRSQHGFMKIYDKSAEQKQKDSQLTRIEHTLDASKPVSLEKVTILEVKSSTLNPNELDNLNYCIVTLCHVLQANGIDFEPYISKLNYRRRQRILPYLYGNSMVLEYDLDILDKLLKYINNLFDADIGHAKENDESTVDTDGFIFIGENIDTPFT